MLKEVKVKVKKIMEETRLGYRIKKVETHLRNERSSGESRRLNQAV
jgi:tRNA A-37 threonylcarbamoyl transferase component Bud32